MKWDKIAGVRRELKKMAREAMGREYIFSVTFACMMNLIPWVIHKSLGSHWAVGIISSTIRRCGFAGLSIPLLCFSLRIILRNMLIVLPISIFVQQNMRVGAQDSLYQIFWAEEIRPLDFIRFGFRRYWHNFSGMMMVNIRVFSLVAAFHRSGNHKALRILAHAVPAGGKSRAHAEGRNGVFRPFDQRL